MSVQRIQKGKWMSQAVIHAGTVYLSGQIADDISADIRRQTSQILKKIDALLGTAGSDKTKLLTANIWLADMADFAEMNREWEVWVPEGLAPARATVQATLFTPAHRIEIAVVAAQ